MPDWAIWTILIIGAYLLGALPVSYLVARARGIDLTKQGTKQVGGGNLWRTTSRKFGLSVGIFDFLKGMIMVSIAHALGLDIAQQVVVGLAAVIGHNWPVFLRFHGGRGASTTLGIVIIIPVINDSTTLLPMAISICIVVIGTVIMRSSPLPVFLAAASLPVTYWAFKEEQNVIMAFLAVFLVIAIKRMTAQPMSESVTTSKKQVLLNRLLFDRDIRDRKAWMFQEAIEGQELLEDND
jgi:glycerol-3-phosphate acyltransferase PlsY